MEGARIARKILATALIVVLLLPLATTPILAQQYQKVKLITRTLPDGTKVQLEILEKTVEVANGKEKLRMRAFVKLIRSNGTVEYLIIEINS